VPGKYYPQIKVPADPAAVRQTILEIVNVGRKDPDFRRGNRLVPDLSVEFTPTRRLLKTLWSIIVLSFTESFMRITKHAVSKSDPEAPTTLWRNVNCLGKRRKRLGLRDSALWFSAMLVMSASLATSLPAQANAPVNDLARLEHEIAETLSYIRQHPEVMVQDLQAMLAKPDGPYKHLLPDGAPVWSEAAWLKASIAEAKIQPKLNALRWSDSLAQVARAWAPEYARNSGVRHGRYGERTKNIHAMVIEAIGPSDAIRQTSEFNPKSFVYMFWVSSKEWRVGSAYDPKANKGRGHRGIVNDTRMTAVGVGCASRSTNDVVCVIDLGKDVSDQGPLLMADGAVSSAPPKTSNTQTTQTSNGTCGKPANMIASWEDGIYREAGVIKYVEAGVIKDATHNGYDGILKGGAKIVRIGIFGRQAIKLNGQSDYVVVNKPIPASKFASGEYTISGGFKTSKKGANQDIISILNKNNKHGILIELSKNGKLRYFHRVPFGNGGGVNLYSKVGNLNDGKFHFFKAFHNSDELRLSIDGKSQGRTAAQESVFDQDLYITIGKLLPDENHHHRYFNGILEDIKIYNSAVSCN